MKYKGYYINLTPMKVENLWRLEIEKGDYTECYTFENNQTLYKVQEFACNQIDKLIAEEVRS
jgi:hypothetical protein